MLPDATVAVQYDTVYRSDWASRVATLIWFIGEFAVAEVVSHHEAQDVQPVFFSLGFQVSFDGFDVAGGSHPVHASIRGTRRNGPGLRPLLNPSPS
ncbi:MAG: hypothetical protein L0387_22295 [Acidobacteria bacterium]|nr:hypothetical protein [Acidobacteriota bacterium]MCI0718430.1 hypothetical protein [Acidobacteriota bacterium]